MDMAMLGISLTTMTIRHKLTILTLSKWEHIKLQTSGGYQSSGYSNQNSLWNDGNYGHYHYSSYQTYDSNGSHNSSTMAATPLQYQQQSQNWANQFSQNASDVSCAPGTENMSVTTASAVDCPIPGFSGGYTSNNQPPPPGTTSWRPVSSSSELPSLQVSTTGNHDDYWKVGAPGFQNNHINQVQSYYQKPLDSNPLQYGNFEDQQKSVHPQVPSSQFTATHQVPQNFHSSLQTVPTLDARRVSKLQIQTNPRIASTLALGMPKTDKDSSTTDAALKPAYISVSMPKSNNKVLSHDAADSKPPRTIPPSFCAYVERALARCKDDSQKAACQSIMREMTAKASADGTLFTRDWDTEPLFPLPDSSVDSINKAKLQSSATVSSLPKYRRSPSRRTKSRWEPIPEDKLAEKIASVNHASVKDARWDRPKEREKVASIGKYESKDGSFNLPSKDSPRQAKKQRLGDSSSATENGDASSDSDKEKGLTKYYSGAVALENTPEERKKRENRSKRFEKGHEHRADIKHFRPRGAGAGNLYTRRTSALLLSKNNESSSSRAVEDIDWDALTVKGTCQEVEKRYLRLTSAPDPATVRPEDVLEKALLMVQSSQKNYFYKCDQLKSIRQDLTVQRIRNELTVKVYETHARLALEAGDLPEYNQCQSQLKILYAEGIKGCELEFSAYNLLCVILHSNNNRDLLSSMARLSAEAKKDEAVKHALAVRAAVTSGNYVLFFRLYKMAPNMNTLLMDLYVEKMRFEAVKCMSRSYRPAVPVAFVAQVLGFTSNVQIDGDDEKDMDGLEECEEWLKAHGASLVVDNNGEQLMDTKVTSSSLYMPEPDDAVAHGDATLAVNDFLTRTS
ncbi:SAC3 family protein A isoform X4 [Magnolia sinica]|uniref:SAC3 family protein A isoform X4 n=1 Tax=Magnolia sinica TaxID=86752 RepID=UPI00265846A7|nr:SAC3 family protein A isoform X4 [Magnolia sinica]